MLFRKRFGIVFIFLFLLMFGISKNTNHLNDVFVKEHEQKILTLKESIVKIKKNDELKVAPVREEKLKKHITCLAKNIYYEARGEPFFGQVAVARVVLNRIKDPAFPNNSCDVVYQKTFNRDLNKYICQFSWVCENLMPPLKTSSSYKLAIIIAELVLLKNEWSNLIHDSVLFFHSVYIDPKWKYEYVTTIGNHKFFRLNDDDNT